MKHQQVKKQALVLSGGGAYGAYEVGILKALATNQCSHTQNEPFDPTVFAGTSAGAVNTAVYVGQLNSGHAAAAQVLETFWIDEIADGPGRCGNGVYRLRGVPFDLFDIDCALSSPVSTVRNLLGDSLFLANESIRRTIDFGRSTKSITRRALSQIDISLLIVTTRIREGLTRAVSIDGIRQAKKELRILSTNFDTGELVVFDEQDVTDRYGTEAVLASAAIPGLFSPVMINGQRHVDGQTLLKTPLLREFADCDTIHLVYMDPDISAIPAERLQSTIAVLDRIVVINNANKINEDLRTLQHINQSLELLDSINGMHKDVDERISAFYKAASKVALRLQSSLPPYRKITVHRYHPREDLGGVLGLMDLGHQHIANLIDRGFTDAIRHDCHASGCIIPSDGSRVKHEPGVVSPAWQLLS